MLKDSAAAHGSAAFAGMHDVNVAYSGKWHRLVSKLQPELVDAGFRGGSEERILLGENLIAQAHLGPNGHKQVVRHATPREKGEIRVWFNDELAHDAPRREAAALVVDAYSLFLFGPMLLATYEAAGRGLVMQIDGFEELIDGTRRYPCDILRIHMQPGLGLSDADDMALFIDRDTRLMRRIRFTLEGLESTRGALVDVDTLDPVILRGVRWPTRFHEKLLRPAPLQVHDWHLTGLDIDRGFDSAAIAGQAFAGLAGTPATPLRKASP